MKLHEIIIGLIVVALVISGILIFMGDAVTKYDVIDYNSTALVKLNNTYSEIDNITIQTKDKLEQLQAKNNLLNILDAFFTQAYSAIRITAKSFESFDIITDAATSDLPYLGRFGAILRSHIATILMIVIFIGLMLAFLIKHDKV